MSKPTPHTCSGQIFQGLRHHGCINKGKLEHNGKWYCGTHHPPTIEAKRKEKNEAYIARIHRENESYKQRIAALTEQKRRADLYPELLVALENYMSAFGQALEAHGIPFGDQQRAADSEARAALAKAKGEPQ